MPQINFIQAGQREPTALERTLSSFAERDMEIQKETRDADQLEKIYKEHLKDGQNIQGAIQAVQTNRSLSPTKKVAEVKRLSELEKYNQTLQRDAQKNINNSKVVRGIEREYGYKENELADFDSDPTAARQVAFEKSRRENKPAPVSQFDKTVQAEEAKKYVALQDDILKAKDSLANLDRIDKLANDELAGVKGYIKAAIGTEAAKEMSNLSFTSIEPIIKLFNPVGPIPVAKVNIIREQFQAHPSDLRTTIAGKNAALRRIANQGIARAEERIRMIKENNGKVPEEVLKKFDEESSQLVDVLADQESFNIKLDAAGPDGTISGLYSKDGKPLNPIPAKEAKKLYEQGLITNVPR